MSVTRREIVAGLEKLGVTAGDMVTVHSSLKSLGHVEGGPHTLIDALLDVIGPQGTILMPAFTFSLRSQEEPVFDVKETPSCVGLVSEVFRKEYATHRSIHLTHSYSAAGSLAAELASHRLDITPCGKDSPIAGLLRRDGKILLVGVGYNTCTAFHVVEEMLEVPYMSFRVNEKAKYRLNGELLPLPSRILVRGFKYDFTIMDEEFRSFGVLREEKIGDAAVKVLQGAGFAACVESRLTADIDCFFRGH